MSRKMRKKILLGVAVGGPFTIVAVTATALLTLAGQAPAIGLAALPCVVALMLAVGAWVGDRPP